MLDPHFIRCIKPNAIKEPAVFTTKMVLRQLQYAGLFEAIRIRKSGFPFRLPYHEFTTRFRVCLNNAQLKQMKTECKDDKAQALFIMKCLKQHLDEKEWAIVRRRTHPQCVLEYAIASLQSHDTLSHADMYTLMI